MRAPAEYLKVGWIERIQDSGVLVRLEDGRLGRVRWLQLGRDVSDIGALYRQAEVWQQQHAQLGLVVLDHNQNGPELSKRLADEFPWPGAPPPDAFGTLVTAVVEHVGQTTAIAVLANGLEASVDLVRLRDYLGQSGVLPKDQAVEYADELEGYLRRRGEPRDACSLPPLSLDVVRRLQELEPTRQLQLPRRRRPSGARAPIAARDLRVVVVDNNEAARTSMSWWIDRWQCDVETAGSVPELVTLIRRSEVSGYWPDVVFLDLDLPTESDGFAAIDLVNQHWARARLVVVTAKPTPPPAPHAGLRVSSVIAGVVDDERMEAELRPDPERHPWREFTGAEAPAPARSTVTIAPGITFSSAAARQPLTEHHLQLLAVLQSLVIETGAERAAIVGMHAQRRLAKVLAVVGSYPETKALVAQDARGLVVNSCLGNVLLRRIEYTTCQRVDCTDARHNTHSALVGEYRSLIALPIEATGAERHGLFLFDHDVGDGDPKAAYAASVKAARHAAIEMGAALTRKAMVDRDRCESGLLRAGLLHAGVWHDLAKQLVIHTGQAEQLLRYLKDPSLMTPAQARELAEAHREQIAHTNTLTRKSLDATIWRKRSAVIDVPAVAKAAVDSLADWQSREHPGGHVRIILHGPIGALHTTVCHGVADHLERTLLNLGVNAIEHMLGFCGGRGGQLSVRLEAGEPTPAIRDELVRVRHVPPEQHPDLAWWLTVTDTGPGIPSYLRDDIFQPLFSTKEDAEPNDDEWETESGHGLGLTIARALTEDALGGWLYIPHAPRFVGATFRIVLPATSEETAP